MLNSGDAVGVAGGGGTTAAVDAATTLDGAAIKPREVDLERVHDLPFERITIDYEGHGYVPDVATLEALAETREVRLTIPVRADGYDPLGDRSALDAVPAGIELVFVAGNPAYLDEGEQRRSIAPRLGALVEETPDAWVGTEGIERLALATGATQFELLSRTTEHTVDGLRAAGFAGDVAVYAPTVLTDDEDEILDALGGYVSRRRPVARALPSDGFTDRRATGRTRSVLLAAARDYGLVGSMEAVNERAAALRSAGVDAIVGYPARGVDEFVG